MYAVLLTVTIDPAERDQADRALHDVVVPMVAAAPGFVAGYWFEQLGGQGLSMVVFDTEANARATVPPVGSTPMVGVTVANAEFRPISASA